MVVLEQADPLGNPKRDRRQECADPIPRNLHANAKQQEGRQPDDHRHSGISDDPAQPSPLRSQQRIEGCILPDCYHLPSFWYLVLVVLFYRLE
jgi:hypothetical protein